MPSRSADTDRLHQAVGAAAATASDSVGPNSAAMILDELRRVHSRLDSLEPRLLSETHVSYLTRWVEERQALERVGGRWKGIASAVGAFALAGAVVWGGFADMVKHALGITRQ